MTNGLPTDCGRQRGLIQTAPLVTFSDSIVPLRKALTGLQQRIPKDQLNKSTPRRWALGLLSHSNHLYGRPRCQTIGS
jgi:hypothetical protein